MHNLTDLHISGGNEVSGYEGTERIFGGYLATEHLLPFLSRLPCKDKLSRFSLDVETLDVENLRKALKVLPQLKWADIYVVEGSSAGGWGLEQEFRENGVWLNIDICFPDNSSDSSESSDSSDSSESSVPE